MPLLPCWNSSDALETRAATSDLYPVVKPTTLLQAFLSWLAHCHYRNACCSAPANSALERTSTLEGPINGSETRCRLARSETRRKDD